MNAQEFKQNRLAASKPEGECLCCKKRLPAGVRWCSEGCMRLYFQKNNS